jgi:hypothetical protein
MLHEMMPRVGCSPQQNDGDEDEREHVGFEHERQDVVVQLPPTILRHWHQPSTQKVPLLQSFATLLQEHM